MPEQEEAERQRVQNKDCLSFDSCFRRGSTRAAINSAFVARGTGHLTPKITIGQEIWQSESARCPSPYQLEHYQCPLFVAPHAYNFHAAANVKRKASSTGIIRREGRSILKSVRLRTKLPRTSILSMDHFEAAIATMSLVTP